ncbi:hypothetical protein HUJ05_010017 [Dendroctonus ponderosae]|nr:hypothetical protein HUJ05_010017 [Dendroctonus ponderosae]
MTYAFLMLLLLTGLAISNQFQHLSELVPTNAENLPFLAVLYLAKSNNYSVGVVISNKYVLASTNPSADYSAVTVYLGFAHSPADNKNYHYSKGCRIIEAKSVLWEEDVGLVKSTGSHISELVLIELEVPVDFSDTIQPVVLPARNDFTLQTGASLNLTKFNLESANGTPEFAIVQLRTLQKCKLFFGSTFEETEEFCIRTASSVRPALDEFQFSHLPIMLGKQLIGLGRTSLTPAICEVTSKSCSRHQVYRNLGPVVDWIYENSDIVVNDFEN